MTLPPSLPKLKKPRLVLLRRVAGDSMLPALAPGIVVLAVRRRHWRVGDVVIVTHNNLEKIKRIQHIEPKGIFVVGDNPASSTDSRSFGWLPHTAVVAKVVWPRR